MRKKFENPVMRSYGDIGNGPLGTRKVRALTLKGLTDTHFFLSRQMCQIFVTLYEGQSCSYVSVSGLKMVPTPLPYQQKTQVVGNGTITNNFYFCW